MDPNNTTIIMLSTKNDFSQEQITNIESQGEVVWIESSDYINNPVFQNSKEKIIAIAPEIISWKLSNEFIDKVTNLKAICPTTSSFSWLDGKFLRSKGINLINNPHTTTEAVAEYAISLMLNVAKKLPLIVKNNWELDYDQHQGCEIKGKTMGIIGLGFIGFRIAELGKQMGMNVIYWSKNSRNENYEYQELDSLLKNSDFIFPALARNEETKSILSNNKLDLISQNSFIISIADENLFNFEYIYQKIKNKEISGLAMESEKRKMTDYEGNIYITPPIAWFTQESSKNVIKQWVENISSQINNTPKNIVN